MAGLRSRSPGALSRRFLLSALCAAFAPSSTGYQDLAAVFVRQPGVSERWREHLIGSPFGTIHAATFSFSRPIGTAMPEPIEAQAVNFDPRSLDRKTWSIAPPLAHPALQIEYPTVNRRLKGDRMPSPQSAPGWSEPDSLPQLQPTGAPSARPARPPAPPVRSRQKSAEQIDPALSDLEAPIDAFGTLPTSRSSDETMNAAQPNGGIEGRDDSPGLDDEDDRAAADKPPDIPAAGENDAIETPPSPLASLSFLDEDPAERNAQLYFGIAAMGSREGLQQWSPGAAPIAVAPSADEAIKLSALEAPANAEPSGETVAGKDDSSRFKSPAERLGLTGKPRAKAEKCIADAVYFEARGEPLRGQMAVAQVVMNRVFSGRYPDTVCGVVYQNANRHLACQFTFACEGKDLSRIDEPDMWEQAKRIAKEALDGKVWLPEVGHATHYHAYWVHPSWVHEMARLYKLGVHTFYRPRAWGDGSDAPIWGSAPVASKPASAAAQSPHRSKDPAAAPKGPDETAKVPEAAASPERASDKNSHTARL